jgi:hypothetical protein
MKWDFSIFLFSKICFGKFLNFIYYCTDFGVTAHDKTRDTLKPITRAAWLDMMLFLVGCLLRAVLQYVLLALSLRAAFALASFSSPLVGTFSRLVFPLYSPPTAASSFVVVIENTSLSKTRDWRYVTVIITIFVFTFLHFPFLYIFDCQRRPTFVHGHLFLFLEIIVFIFFIKRYSSLYQSW